jgi:hypothetical protein
MMGVRGWWPILASMALAANVMAQVFGPQRPLNTDAAVDARDDSSPKVAAGENGTWVAVWGGEIGGDFDVLMARSLDAGETWSSPRPLDPDAESDGRHDQASEGGRRWARQLGRRVAA